ncbi:MAG: ABC transporter permease [Gemmatimonadales bacterium]|nr:MAG: ABC transporter permease [Gemmatimonadales bacterium]
MHRPPCHARCRRGVRALRPAGGARSRCGHRQWVGGGARRHRRRESLPNPDRCGSSGRGATPASIGGARTSCRATRLGTWLAGDRGRYPRRGGRVCRADAAPCTRGSFGERALQGAAITRRSHRAARRQGLPVRRIAALCRAHWQTMLSYRLQMVVSFAGLIATVVPLYFISGALQPVMANAIKAEGGQSFGFLLIGLTTFSLVSVAVVALPGAVGTSVSSGVFEALLATPTSAPTLLAGLNAFDMLWAALRGAILLTAGWLLGANLVPGQLLPGLGILVLIVLAHIPIGLIGAALVLAFRTAGPLPKGVLMISGLLGGVYYPTHVIPSWLQSLSDFLPLTYGLRALRRVVLQGASIAEVAPDLLALSAATVILFVMGTVAITAAFRYARRQGTLAQY